MDDNIHVQQTGPNGDRLQVSLRDKSVSLASQQLPLIIALAAMAVGLYLAFQALTTNQERAFANQREGFHKMGAVVDLLHANQAALRTELQTWREQVARVLQEQNGVLHTHNETVSTERYALQTHLETVLTKQNELLAGQTQTLDARLDEMEKVVGSGLSELARRLEILAYNIANPDRALPLRAPVPPEEHLPERPR
jgi:hypothetical protein